MAISICIVLSSPLFLMFVPKAVAKMVYHSTGTWDIFVPGANYIVYGVGFFLLLLAALLPFLMNVRKVSIILCIICIMLSAASFFIASQSYRALSEDRISYRMLFSAKDNNYSWDQLEAVVYNPETDGKSSEYKFLFNDGNSMTISENGYLVFLKSRLHNKLREIGIKIE